MIFIGISRAVLPACPSGRAEWQRDRGESGISRRAEYAGEGTEHSTFNIQRPTSKREGNFQTTAVAGRGRNLYLHAMKLAEIEQEALALPDRERASLAAILLDTLPPPGTDVSDQEVERREQELDSGRVAAISHEEFVRRVQQERGR